MLFTLLKVTFWRLQYVVKDTSYCLATNNSPKAQIFKVFICRGKTGEGLPTTARAISMCTLRLFL